VLASRGFPRVADHFFFCLAFVLPPLQKLFLGLSFSVPDIELAINFLKGADLGANNPIPPQPPTSSPTAGGGSTAAAAARLEIQHIPGFPRFISFVDPAFISLEITDGAMAISSSRTTIHSTGHAMHAMGGSGSSAAMNIRSMASLNPSSSNSSLHSAYQPARTSYQPHPPSTHRPTRLSNTLDSDSESDLHPHVTDGGECSDGGVVEVGGGATTDSSVSSEDENTAVSGFGLAANLANAMAATHGNIVPSHTKKGRRTPSRRHTPQG
jgi:hypothetical protein